MLLLLRLAGILCERRGDVDVTLMNTVSSAENRVIDLEYLEMEFDGCGVSTYDFGRWFVLFWLRRKRASKGARVHLYRWWSDCALNPNWVSSRSRVCNHNFADDDNDDISRSPPINLQPRIQVPTQ